MTSEHLLRAVGQIDDDLILEARRPVRRTVLLRRLSTAAAAVVLCVGLLSAPALYSHMSRSGKSSSPDSAEDSDTKEYQYDVVYMPFADDAANRSESSQHKGSLPHSSVNSDGEVTAGIFEPRFITWRGTYLPLADSFAAADKLSPTLPADAVSLGTLQLHPCDDPSVPTTPTESLVGCPVWESEDGQSLYIQLDNGLWITARLIE